MYSVNVSGLAASSVSCCAPRSPYPSVVEMAALSAAALGVGAASSAFEVKVEVPVSGAKAEGASVVPVGGGIPGGAELSRVEEMLGGGLVEEVEEVDVVLEEAAFLAAS